MKKNLLLTILLLIFNCKVFSQEYLDSEKRYLKLKEVSTDDTYGFDFKNPIKIGAESKAVGTYLNAIKTSDGDRIHIKDLQNDFNGMAGLTMIILNYEKSDKLATLYFSTTEYITPKAPKGFLFKTTDDLPKAAIFHPDSIKKVNTCSKKLYSVDNFLLNEKLGAKPVKPKSNPAFIGGTEELKKYFVDHPLTNEKSKHLLFKVSIAFIVNCENKAGNFQIITKGKGELETYANQVLAIVNDMPQNWQAAKLKGNPVDCYQVLSFTVKEGKLDDVSYKEEN